MKNLWNFIAGLLLTLNIGVDFVFTSFPLTLKYTLATINLLLAIPNWGIFLYENMKSKRKPSVVMNRKEGK